MMPQLFRTPKIMPSTTTAHYVAFSDDCQNFTSQALKAGGWTNDFANTTLDPTD